MKGVNFIKADTMTLKSLMSTQKGYEDNWVIARPERFTGLIGLLQKGKALWLILTGKADIIVWEDNQ